MGGGRMLNQRRQLKNLWLNPAYQGKYIGSLVASSLIVMFAFGIVFNLIVRENIEIVAAITSMPEASQKDIYAELERLLAYLAVAGFVFLATVAGIGLIFSHRAAGPLFNVKAICRQIVNGDLNARINLRPEDEFRDIAEFINASFDKIMFPHSKCLLLTEDSSSEVISIPVERLKASLNEGRLKPTTMVKDPSNPDAPPQSLAEALKKYS
jgi:methyl-accepting chemotaxis protein